MISKKLSHKGVWKKVLSALMTATMLCSTSVYAIEIGETNVYGGEKLQFTNEELASMVNPILQSYEADSSMKLWEMTSDT